ncbi:MAG: histidinol-phosphate transaminase [Dehalococcoidia bacterium]|nr:histidinol-phosphate transaminase [Dehalococcoidia bacterium]
MTDGRRAHDIRRLVRPHLLELPGYEPVEPVDVVAQRLGIPEDRIVKLDGNENPYGPSPKVAAALGAFGSYHLYPDPAQRRLRRAVGQYVGADPEQIVLGSGSDEMLDLAAQLFLSPGDTMVNAPPTFGMYDFLGAVYNARVVQAPRREDFGLDLPALEAVLRSGARLLYLAAPNNPTGNPLPREQLERLLRYDTAVVLDEAYAEFDGESAVDLVAQHDNLIVVRTFSKWAGLAGMRAGYAVLPPPLVDIVWKVKIPYNLSVASEQAILASLDDRETLKEHVRLITEERVRLSARLAQLPWLRPYPSTANFILCEVRGVPAVHVRDQLRKRGIMIRYFDTPSLRNCVRISIGKPEHSERLTDALREIGAGVAG